MSLQDRVVKTVTFGKKVSAKVSPLQFRATCGSAVAVVNGVQEVLNVYNTQMNADENKVLFKHIADVVSAAIRTAQGVIFEAASEVNMSDQAVAERMSKGVQASRFETTVQGVTVMVDGGSQSVLSISVEGKADWAGFLAELVKALNGAIMQSRASLMEAMQEVAKEMDA